MLVSQSERGKGNIHLYEEDIDPTVSLRAIFLLLMNVTTSVFVNGRSRPAIFENMKARIARGDIQAERLEALQVSQSYPNDFPFPAPSQMKNKICGSW